MRARAAGLVLACLAALAAISYFWFPGHTYLQQDTQIYVPMLERLWDPSALTRDLVTSRPHLAYTIYDETAFVLRRVFGLSFRYGLEVEQLVFRFVGLLGVYLAGTALGLNRRASVALAALFGLGATIVGPQILTFEYEPIPRGFALMLILLGLGFGMRGEMYWAAVCGSAAVLFQAPATAPFWLVFAIVWLRSPSRRWAVWAPLAAALAILFLLSRLQPGITERQHLFGTIPPDLEALQRMRTPYDWVSLWPASVFWHYGALAIATCAAVWRLGIRDHRRTWLLGLTAAGVASVPFAYLVLDVMRWAMMPQFQPGRAVLYVTACAVVACSAAALRAGREISGRSLTVAVRWRVIECAGWLIVPVIIPLHKSVLPLLTFNFIDPLSVREAIVLLACIIGLAAVAVRPVAVLVVYAAFATVAGVANYPWLWTPEIVSLSTWARANSPKEAVFHFPDAGKALYPGIFRAEALRAVYVDWKSGGQVNYFETLGLEWWQRYQDTIVRQEDSAKLKARGIDYVVVRPQTSWTGGTQVWSNGGFVVYRL